MTPKSLNGQEAADLNTPSERLIELAKINSELAQIVSNNPHAPATLLQKLGLSSDAIVCQNVAANPNTPTEILLKLGAEFPEQLLNNPIFSLLLLENPNLVKEIPLTTLKSLLKQKTVPISFLEWAANHPDPDVKFAVATNPQTPSLALNKLVISQSAESKKYELWPYVNLAGELFQSLDEQAVEAARLHVNWAGEMTSNLDKTARKIIQNITLQVSQEHENGYALLELQKIGLIPDFVIKYILTSKIPDLQIHYCYQLLQEAAKSAHTSPSVLEQFAGSEKLRPSIPWNPNTPPYLIEKLAVDERAEVRGNVALSPYTPVRILEQLAQDEDAVVRQKVGWNLNASARILEQLDGLAKLDYSYPHILESNGYEISSDVIQQMSLDSRSEVRKNIAKYRHTPANILEGLARDEEAGVRRMVALNIKTPARVLLGELVRDADVGVRTAVAVRFDAIAANLFSDLSATSWDEWTEKFASHENSNNIESLLIKLAQHQDSSVRGFVAQFSDIPLNLLEKLAFDDELNVRKCVVMNQTVPTSLLEQVVKREKSDEVRLGIAKHPNTSASLLEQIFSDRQISDEKLDEIRLGIAKHPNTSASLLEQLFSDRNSRVRRVAISRYLMQNPLALPQVIERYAKNSLPFFPLLMILLHPKTPATVLAENRQSQTWLLRYAIAQNPNTSLDTLSTLVEDINRIVRATAKANLQSRTQQL